MPHLLYNCHGDLHCLDTYARNVSTIEPAATLYQENFVDLTIEEQGLLDIAAHGCSRTFHVTNQPLMCETSTSHRHPMKLVVTEQNIVRVLNDDFGLHQCSCPRGIWSAPRSLSRCILNAWGIWLERLRRWEALLNDPDYRSPSPDLPPLEELHKAYDELHNSRSHKRTAAEVSDSDEESGSSSPSPPPAKRLRTGPCELIVAKMEVKSATATGSDEDGDEN
ncbi:hypothetical protein V5O48_017459 [Marasmius crinis-equi]|uniref:Uncharacterized protein n=1 Tax=Marasmius crinis-equi TaxID=585013 RepID=A0ABR3ENV8_9AGAR